MPAGSSVGTGLHRGAVEQLLIVVGALATGDRLGTTGIQLADQQFQRRVAAGLTMLTSVVQTAADNADEVFATVEGGIEDFIASDDDIIITDYRESEIRPYWMIDTTNGSAVRPPVEFTSSTPAFANLTRARPEAYIIPVAWAGLAERLMASGLEVETMDEPFSGTVEAFNITSTPRLSTRPP